MHGVYLIKVIVPIFYLQYINGYFLFDLCQYLTPKCHLLVCPDGSNSFPKCIDAVHLVSTKSKIRWTIPRCLCSNSASPKCYEGNDFNQVYEKYCEETLLCKNGYKSVVDSCNIEFWVPKVVCKCIKSTTTTTTTITTTTESTTTKKIASTTKKPKTRPTEKLKTTKTTSSTAKSTYPVTTSSPSELKSFREIMLKKHNNYREKHSTGPLVLSTKLNEIAQKYAEELATTHVFEHSTTKYGENLSYRGNSGSLPDGIDSIDAWYDEIKDWDFATSTSNGVTGHFTQVIWKATTEVGCGRAGSLKGVFHRIYVVCNYNTAGNFAGQYSTNVLPLSA